MLKYEDAPLGDYVKCPLLDKETIPSGDCFLMSTVAEGITPKICVEKKFFKRYGFRIIKFNYFCKLIIKLFKPIFKRGSRKRCYDTVVTRRKFISVIIYYSITYSRKSRINT